MQNNIFSVGTKVRVKQEFTQDIRTMGKIYTVVDHKHTERGFVMDHYLAVDSSGELRQFSDHLLEEVPENEVPEGASFFEVLYAPYGTKGFSPHDDTVLRCEENGWVTTARNRHPLSEDELKALMPIYFVGTWL